MNPSQIIAVVIFAVTMAAIMTEKIHRTAAAIAGAILLILTKESFLQSMLHRKK